MKSRREENVEATRFAILDAATNLIGTRGYADVAIVEIAEEARVTTGAVYHHFRNKKAVLKAVAEGLEAELLTEAATITHDDPWLQLTEGFKKVVERCTDPKIHRILFIEAPQVIGPEAWREIELKYAYGAMRQTLQSLIEAGVVPHYPVDLLSRLVLSLLREVSEELAKDNSPAERERVDLLIDRFFDALVAD